MCGHAGSHAKRIELAEGSPSTDPVASARPGEPLWATGLPTGEEMTLEAAQLFFCKGSPAGHPSKLSSGPGHGHSWAYVR